MSYIIAPESQEIVFEASLDPRMGRALDELSEHHPYTCLHSYNVAFIGVDLGLEEGMNQGLLTVLAYSGLLHDVGKTEVPLEILEGQDLDERARRMIRTHPRWSFLAADSSELLTVKKIVAQHHEFQPDSYPRSGEDRRVVEREHERREEDLTTRHLAEIISIADKYDALRSERSYSPGKTRSETEAILREIFTGDSELIDLVLKR